MTITKNSDTSLQMNFTVTLDYTLCDVSPSEYRSMINMPATNIKTFKASSKYADVSFKTSSDGQSINIIANYTEEQYNPVEDDDDSPFIENKRDTYLIVTSER